MPDLSDQIEEAATSPASATADGVSVQARSVEEMIAADRYLAQKEAAANGSPRHGIRITKLLMPGSR